MKTDLIESKPKAALSQFNSAEGDGLETARILYDHVSSLVDEDHRTDDRVIVKVDKLLIVHTAMFAGIGYGIQNIEWTLGVSPFWFWLAVILGAISALGVVVAFCAGIRCLFLVNRPVAGLGRIKERLENNSFFRDPPVDAYRGLTQNLSISLDEYRKAKATLKSRSQWLNWATMIGAISAALFLAVSLGGSTISKWSYRNAERTKLAAE